MASKWCFCNCVLCIHKSVWTFGSQCASPIVLLLLLNRLPVGDATALTDYIATSGYGVRLWLSSNRDTCSRGEFTLLLVPLPSFLVFWRLTVKGSFPKWYKKTAGVLMFPYKVEAVTKVWATYTLKRLSNITQNTVCACWNTQNTQNLLWFWRRDTELTKSFFIVIIWWSNFTML